MILKRARGLLDPPVPDSDTPRGLGRVFRLNLDWHALQDTPQERS